jgi:hypothetical protein
MGWGENDRGVSFTFGAEVVSKFLHKHDFDLICRAHQVRETFSVPSTRYVVVIPCHAFQKVTVMDLFAYPVQFLKNMFLPEIQRKNLYKINHTSWKVQYLQNCVGIRFSDVLYFKLRQMERIPNTCFCYNTLSLNVESRFVLRYWTAQP